MKANRSSGFENSSFENRSAFTLIELLVVISILGLLAALVVPAIKDIGKSNITVGATRQLLDDVGHARQLAVANRTTVYMVFMPTNFWNQSWLTSPQWNQTDLNAVTNLIDKQLTSYTFISCGTVGDQPGQHQWHYLTPWRSLPDGTFVASQKFAPKLTNTIYDAVANVTYIIPPFNYMTNMTGIPFPFPLENSPIKNPPISLPYIAFNYLGQLTDDGVTMANLPEYITLERGSVTFPRDPVSKAPVIPPTPMVANDITESPLGNSTNSGYNLVEIDPLTGRATLHFQKLP